MRANEQQTVWYAFTRKGSKANEARTALGPVKVGADDRMLRNFDCTSYESCLFYSARRLWHRFTCAGCRLSTPVRNRQQQS